jgi:hypothetical protein
MVEELTSISRQLLNNAPRWVIGGLAAAPLLGAIAKILCEHSPFLQEHLTPYFDFGKLSIAEWGIVGVVIAVPVAFIWRHARRLAFGKSPIDSAEEYIRIINLAMKAADLPQTDRRQQWRNAVESCAQCLQGCFTPPSRQGHRGA